MILWPEIKSVSGVEWRPTTATTTSTTATATRKREREWREEEEGEEEEATPLGLLMKHNGALTNCNGVSARGTTM